MRNGIDSPRFELNDECGDAIDTAGVLSVSQTRECFMTGIISSCMVGTMLDGLVRLTAPGK